MARFVSRWSICELTLMGPPRPTDLFYEKRYSHTAMVNPDFVALAKAMHCHGIRCDSLADLPAKMDEFMRWPNDSPIVFDARVVRTEHVYPMVRPHSLLVEITDSDHLVFGCRSQQERLSTNVSSTPRSSPSPKATCEFLNPLHSFSRKLGRGLVYWGTSPSSYSLCYPSLLS